MAQRHLSNHGRSVGARERTGSYWRQAALLLGALRRTDAAARAKARGHLTLLGSPAAWPVDGEPGEVVPGASFEQTVRTLAALRGISEPASWSESNVVLAAFAEAGFASETAIWARALEFAIRRIATVPRRSGLRQPRRAGTQRRSSPGGARSVAGSRRRRSGG